MLRTIQYISSQKVGDQEKKIVKFEIVCSKKLIALQEEVAKPVRNSKLKKSFGFRKKSFSYDTDTKIEPWFQFPITKPGLGRTLKVS